MAVAFDGGLVAIDGGGGMVGSAAGGVGAGASVAGGWLMRCEGGAAGSEKEAGLAPGAEAC